MYIVQKISLTRDVQSDILSVYEVQERGETMADFELLTRDGGTVSILEDGREVTLKEAVGITALSVYKKLAEYSNEENADKRKRLEEKINFQSIVLDSLSNALNAIKKD